MKNELTSSLIVRLMSKDREDAMEAAKDIVGLRGSFPTEVLLRIANRNASPEWSRVCAVVALGFQNRDPAIHQCLIAILNNLSESSLLREHAAEAIGNQQDVESLTILQLILSRTRSLALRESCKYALSQLKSDSVD